MNNIIIKVEYRPFLNHWRLVTGKHRTEDLRLMDVIATGKTKLVVEKNIFEAMQFHLDGLKEEHFRIPKAYAESEMFVFAV